MGGYQPPICFDSPKVLDFSLGGIGPPIETSSYRINAYVFCLMSSSRSHIHTGGMFFFSVKSIHYIYHMHYRTIYCACTGTVVQWPLT